MVVPCPGCGAAAVLDVFADDQPEASPESWTPCCGLCFSLLLDAVAPLHLSVRALTLPRQEVG